MDGIIQSISEWYQSGLGTWLPKEVFVFLVSMIPLIELRGGILLGSLLGMPLWSCNLIAILGNILPIPFVLLFIKQIFAFMKSHHILERFVAWLERRAEKKSKGLERGEFAFLLLFVGIPLPGTGAWTGSLIASLMNFNIKKASIAIFVGIIMAAIIMDIVSYGALGLIFG